MVIEWLQQLFVPLIDPTSRTHWLGILLFVIVGYCSVKRSNVSIVATCKRYWMSKSTQLDIQLMVLNRLIASAFTAISVYATWWLSVSFVHILFEVFGDSPLSCSMPIMMMLYSVVLFVIEDGTRFFLHMAMHRIPFLWRFHQVHHSATELSPMTFFRVHPFEWILYQLRSIWSVGMVAGLMYWALGEAAEPWEIYGVPALGFLLNTLLGNFRHSSIWIQFPPWLERWLISPAQHQLHHSIDMAHWNKNFGTWLAIWDRLNKTLLFSSVPPEHFGVATANHQQELFSVVLQPCWREREAIVD